MRISDWSSDVCSSDLASTAGAVVSFEARFTPPSSRRDGQGWGCCYVKGRIWGCGPSAFHGSCGSFHRGRSDGRAHDTLVITRLAARPLGAAARVVLEPYLAPRPNGVLS